MRPSWGETRDERLRTTELNESEWKWAIEVITRNEKEIYNYENIQGKESSDEELKSIRKSIKNEITNKENSLDDLTLNTPNSSKLQVSVPASLNYLMKAWAAAEGRDLSSIALQCLELGLRDMKRKGSIPSSAVERYDIACRKRIALAEVHKTWETQELALNNHQEE